MSADFSAPASVPGKIFFLGEYAVLTGLPALVAAVGPRFTLRAGGLSGFHPQSPAGLLLGWAERGLGKERLLRILGEASFADPFEGAGGFGASTAQFALLYGRIAREAGWDASWLALWKLYRELTGAGSPLSSPSGADLVAQCEGGLVCFDPSAEKAEQIPGLDLSAVMVFSATGQAGRKVATHEHLGSLGQESARRWASKLEKPLREGIDSARRGELAALGLALGRYADALLELGLELPAATEDRAALGKVPGALGVKGAGALQADALVALVDPKDASARAELRRAAASRGLRLVCDGIQRQEGLRC